MRYWNAAAERVFGFGPAEAVGASMELIIPERFFIQLQTSIRKRGRWNSSISRHINLILMWLLTFGI